MSDKGKPQGQADTAQDRASRIAGQKAARLQAALRDNLRRRKLAASQAVCIDESSVPLASDVADDGQA